MLLITAPHVCFVILGLFFGLPIEMIDHGCDMNTRKYSKIIHKENPDSILIQSRTSRMECDNNRMICRGTPMRRRLTKAYKKFASDFVVVDVHSFPSEQFSGNSQIILLDTHMSKETKSLYKYLSKHFDTKILQGSTLNDIQHQAREFGGKGILIELWDKLSEQDVELIGKIIKKWYKEYHFSLQ